MRQWKVGSKYRERIYLLKDSLRKLMKRFAGVTYLKRTSTWTHILWVWWICELLSSEYSIIWSSLWWLIHQKKLLSNPHLRKKKYILQHFPTLPVLRARGKYFSGRKRQTHSCSKTYKTKDILHCLFCQHGICSRFIIMINYESCNNPFYLLLTHFQKAPEVIVYDKACNLHLLFESGTSIL